MDWKEWIGKKVFIQLKSGSVYSGIVISSDEFFMHIIDRDNMPVTFAISDLIRIKGEK